MLPDMAESMSSSVGLEVLASNAAADMICPDWQYPHCGTCSAIQAFCNGWLESGDRPSIVVTRLPLMSDTCTLHERSGSPSMCTVHAPHCAMPHPNFVPVSLRCSRMTQSSGVSGSASTLTVLSLTVNAMAAMRSSIGDRFLDAGFSVLLLA